MTLNLNTASELYLGRDRQTALALGPRRFRTASGAIRFAMEQAAPVSRRGAFIQIGNRRLEESQMTRLYEQAVSVPPPPRRQGYELEVAEIDRLLG